MVGLWRLLKHRWMDADDSRRAVSEAMADRLAARIAASETRHTGQVRICVEASLPTAYLWRVGPQTPLEQVVRERALAWFGRLRVWDTEDNNGVLIYLLLAEHRIEFVADRGLARRVAPDLWDAAVQGLSAHLRAGSFEDGLTQALEEVSALLVANFPEAPGAAAGPNELPDAVLRV